MAEQAKRESSGFLKQGSVLALASILVRVIGMIYRIPMANIMKDEGNGIYSAAFEIYNILLIISSYGMPMAVSKMVSAKCAAGEYKSAYHIFRCSFVFSIFTGGLAALFVYFGADFLEQKFFSEYHGIAIPLRILAPTIFVVAIMGVFRGLYQGRKTMMPTAVSQILEQIINAVVSVAAAWILMNGHRGEKRQAAWGAAGGTMGTLFGALTALIILFLIYLLYRPIMKKQMRRDHVSVKRPLSSTFRLILATVIPIILSQTVYQLSGIIDVTLFNNVMKSKHVENISTLLGIYSTKYRVLVSVPIAVSTAIASSMIPGLVASYMQRDMKAVREKIGIAVKFNMIIAFPSAMGLSVLAIPIIRLLFPGADYMTGGLMLMTGSVCVIFYALSTVTSGALQSLDQMNLPVIHALISLIVHVVLVFVLLKFTPLGVYALVAGNVTYPLLVCYLNGKSVRKCIRKRQEIVGSFCVPFLSSFVMGVCTFLVYQGFFLLTHRIYIAIFPAVAVAVAVYFVMILKLKGLSREELLDFPMGRRLQRAADKFHLL